jgi:hypothetical protein
MEQKFRLKIYLEAKKIWATVFFVFFVFFSGWSQSLFSGFFLKLEFQYEIGPNKQYGRGDMFPVYLMIDSSALFRNRNSCNFSFLSQKLEDMGSKLMENYYVQCYDSDLMHNSKIIDSFIGNIDPFVFKSKYNNSVYVVSVYRIEGEFDICPLTEISRPPQPMLTRVSYKPINKIRLTSISKKTQKGIKKVFKKVQRQSPKNKK